MRRWLCGAGLCLALATGAAAQDMSQRLGSLHDALLLNADQAGAWTAYVAALQPEPQVAASHHAADLLLPQLTTPRRIALIDATLDRETAQRLRQEAAVKAFYGGLSPGQQRLFDMNTLPAPVAPR
jgi:hypothetical protein